jgi:hypothetical protein
LLANGSYSRYPFGFAASLHAPPLHVSATVHGFPSSHGLPSFAGCAVQLPLFVSHTPSAHTLDIAEQSFATAPPHTPAVHFSPVMHLLPSSHAPPSFEFCASHFFATLHTPFVHALLNCEQPASLSHSFGAHFPSLQNPDRQSGSPPHTSPSPQPMHPPPQSTSVSAPFFLPSPHDGGVHTSFAHTSLTQSASPTQPSLSSHGPHPPPQSTSVSSPFFAPSEQLGSVHSPMMQLSVAQSIGVLHTSPSPHAAHTVPPQSTSVSSWLSAPSSHDGSIGITGPVVAVSPVSPCSVSPASASACPVGSPPGSSVGLPVSPSPVGSTSVSPSVVTASVVVPNAVAFVGIGIGTVGVALVKPPALASSPVEHAVYRVRKTVERAQVARMVRSAHNRPRPSNLRTIACATAHCPTSTRADRAGTFTVPPPTMSPDSRSRKFPSGTPPTSAAASPRLIATYTVSLASFISYASVC